MIVGHRACSAVTTSHDKHRLHFPINVFALQGVTALTPSLRGTDPACLNTAMSAATKKNVWVQAEQHSLYALATVSFTSASSAARSDPSSATCCRAAASASLAVCAFQTARAAASTSLLCADTSLTRAGLLVTAPWSRSRRLVPGRCSAGLAAAPLQPGPAGPHGLG